MEKGVAFAQKHWLVLILGAFLCILIVLHAFGYRVGNNGLPVKVGTLFVTDVPDGTVVFIDSSRRYTVTGGGMRTQLLPGSHEVIVDSGSKYPWNELVTIPEGGETHVRPVLVAIKAVHTPLAPESTQEGVAKLFGQTLPTRERPLILANGCANVFTSGTRIVGEALQKEGCTVPAYLICGEETRAEFGVCLPTVIFDSSEGLRNVFAYPGRDDTLIITSGNLAYVLELDPREPRFFAPLIKGPGIRVAPWSDTSVIISTHAGPEEIAL